MFGTTPALACKAYERFVAQGLGQSSPWEALSGQIYLGSEGFLKRMQKLADAHPGANLTRSHRQPLRPSATAVLRQVARQYGIGEKSVLDRAQPLAFKTAVYRLRREANLTLGEVAALAGVSAPRVSQIQAEMERPGKRKTIK